MKKTIVILASLVLFAGVSFGQDAKPAAKPADKKETKAADTKKGDKKADAKKDDKKAADSKPAAK
ncbi:MAG TPA: hypothetical protein VN922_07805 [Bacteroidia bacterium]|nr:hypothetical protein [Bacteroidia bacterium]